MKDTTKCNPITMETITRIQMDIKDMAILLNGNTLVINAKGSDLIEISFKEEK